MSIDQKQARVDWCKKIIKKYNHGTSKPVYNIDTGDESCIYACNPETKQQSTCVGIPRSKSLDLKLPTLVQNGLTEGLMAVATNAMATAGTVGLT
ncbi:hypothetical protein EVAR_26800_1 [Eumeta japonica]|uniref:Uncharacterized protein n=1 Tax=Eumeta variegata TaxID=151549 RepID=A0A4C1WF20_EUMVA|nr:hypothetical protein EVAR_26800_1 [Eumeta japonica]